jgi:hypothetical protein
MARLSQRRRVRRSEKGLLEPSQIELAKSEAVTQESLGRSPISANLRSLGLYTEDLSRRESVKVAQYEVLRNNAKRQVRPGTIESLGVGSRTPLSDCLHRSIVPSGTDSSLITLTQHFVLLS